MPRGIPGSGPWAKKRRRRKASAGVDGRRRRAVRRQPKDFRFEVTEFGLRVQIGGKYTVTISEMQAGAAHDDDE